MKRKLIILVVDDEKSVLELFHRILNKKEYTVLTANNGKEALELADKERPDLVILDLNLPGISGIEVLRRIKEIDENIEVIVITGYGTTKTVKSAMRLGAYDYITKPFDINHVGSLIKEAFLPLSDNSSLKKLTRGK